MLSFQWKLIYVPKYMIVLILHEPTSTWNQDFKYCYILILEKKGMNFVFNWVKRMITNPSCKLQ